MKVSVINGQISYGIDLSEQGAEIFYITQEEFTKIQSGLAEFVNGKVIDKEIIGPTEEELQAIKDETLVDIRIPIAVATSPTVKSKIENICFLYSTIKRTTKDGIMTLSNIVFKDIGEFLTQSEYDQFIAVGVEFDELINELFTSEE